MFNNMKNGFTIIELVISILVLSLGIIGIFTAFSMMTILASESSDRLTATYLAQEGIEVVRNIRDTNWLNMDSCVADPTDPNCPAAPAQITWIDSNLNSCSTGCEADYTSTSMSGVTTDYLREDANGFYNYTDGTDTKYKRKIMITQLPDVNNQVDDHIIKVVVQVSWDKKATLLSPTILAGAVDPNTGTGACDSRNCVTVEGVLYDWYNYKSQSQSQSQSQPQPQ